MGFRWTGEWGEQVNGWTGEWGEQVNGWTSEWGEQVNGVNRWMGWTGEWGEQVNGVNRWMGWTSEWGEQVNGVNKWMGWTSEWGEQVNGWTSDDSQELEWGEQVKAAKRLSVLEDKKYDFVLNPRPTFFQIKRDNQTIWALEHHLAFATLISLIPNNYRVLIHYLFCNKIIYPIFSHDKVWPVCPLYLCSLQWVLGQAGWR